MFRIFVSVVSVSFLCRVCCGQPDENLSLPRQSRARIPLNRKPTQLDPMLSGQWFLCKRGLSIQACRHNQNRHIQNRHNQNRHNPNQHSSSATALDLLAASPALRQRTARCTAELCVHGSCTNDRCICASGWKGQYCTNDVNECEKQLGPCSHVCTNTRGSYTCSCRERHTLSEDRNTCTPDRTEPSESISSVRTPALPELYTQMKRKMEVAKLQQKRQISPSSRKRVPSRIPALYRRGRFPRPPSRITNNIQPLASLINEAEAAGRTAMHSIGRFLNKLEIVKHRISPARIRSSFSKKGNPCAKAKCDHKCILTPKHKPVCICRRGHSLGRNGQSCFDSNECASGSHSCQGHSTCINKVGNYSCKCSVGYVLSTNSSKTIYQEKKMFVP